MLLFEYIKLLLMLSSIIILSSIDNLGPTHFLLVHLHGLNLPILHALGIECLSVLWYTHPVNGVSHVLEVHGLVCLVGGGAASHVTTSVELFLYMQG